VEGSVIGLTTGFTDGLKVGSVEGEDEKALIGLTEGFDDGLDEGWNDGVPIGTGTIALCVGLLVGSAVGLEGADDTIVADGGATVGEGLTGAFVWSAGGLVSMETGAIGPSGEVDGMSLGESLG
jgi:hypothetical protein